MLFRKTGEIEEAVSSFEYIMQEQPHFNAGLNLIYCYLTLGDIEKMKKTFQLLLTIPLDIDPEKYNPVANVSKNYVRNCL